MSLPNLYINKDSNMAKTVILTYQDGSICSLLHVENMDENFMTSLDDANTAWNSTEEGLSQDYESFVLGYLIGHGYKVTLDKTYELYGTSL